MAGDPVLRVRFRGRDHLFYPGEEVTIGRSPDARLPVSDPWVSMRHAVLQFTDHRWLFLDVGSRNGSYLHDRPVGRLDLSGATTVRLGHPHEGALLEFSPEPASGELAGVFSRIAAGSASTNDFTRLRAAVTVKGDRNVVQVGKYNINLADTGDIRIEEHVYQGVDAEVIRHALAETVQALEEVVWDPGPGRLRGFSGVVITVGYLVMLTGLGIFAFFLLSSIASFPDFGGPPPQMIVGFAVGVVGGLMAELGKVIRGWEQRRTPQV